MKIDAVIFDVDGTLWDTTDLVAKAWNHAAADFGIQRGEMITGDTLKKEFGKPMDIIMDNLFPEESKETRVKLLKKCCHYEHEILENCKEDILYPGVIETFEAIAKDRKLCIVSNCQSGYIELFMKKNGVEHLVTDKECFGDTLLSKGENIKLVLERNGFQNAIYVGDTIGDYNATVYAQVPFVFAKYGFGNVEGAWKEIDDIREVLDII